MRISFDHGPFRPCLSSLAVLALLAAPACGDDGGETGGGDATEGSTTDELTTGPSTTVSVDESGDSGETETPACQVAAVGQHPSEGGNTPQVSAYRFRDRRPR